MRESVTRYKGIPEWIRYLEVIENRSFWEDVNVLDVVGMGIWCREQEVDLVNHATDLIANLVRKDAVGVWKCCVIFMMCYESSNREPTLRQKHLGLWGWHRFCDDEELPIGHKDAEWGSYAMVQTDEGFCFSGVASFPLEYLKDYLMRDIGLSSKLDVFLSSRDDVLSEDFARLLGELESKKDQSGIAKLLLQRGEIPIRYGTWETESEYSAAWMSS